MHGGGPPVTAGTPLAPEYREENVELVRKGMANLVKHIHNTRQYGIPVIVAINKFASDTDEEMAIVREGSLDAGRHTCLARLLVLGQWEGCGCRGLTPVRVSDLGAADAVVCQHHALGGEGAIDLATAVIKASETKASFKFLYDLDLPIKVCCNAF